ncbi:response regulator [Desulfovibrio sp. OttesenSCG-928-G15]|nr:response regulator [Desulfovibrio sp. OttesenSCG-928-G15]
MKNTVSPFRLWVGQFFARFGLGMRAKLIALFVVIKVFPLVLLALVAWNQSWSLGEDLKRRTSELASKAVNALSQAGEVAVNDAVQALDARATEDIERMSTDTARRVADFLYARDDDTLFAASLAPKDTIYRDFVIRQRGKLVKPGKWVLGPDGKSWVPATPAPPLKQIVSSIEENDHSFNYRPPEQYNYESRALYKEMTFVDLNGNELIKIDGEGTIRKDLKNIADKRNTYVKAEDYFKELQKLNPGEIYVSDVIGEYVGTNIIGMYTPENAEKRGVEYAPEKWAYAGKENPNGKRFKGVVRWATPVEQGGKIIGYVTLALDHDHLMEFTDHIIPTRERYTEIPDAFEGNYAFIWDHKGRSIVHPRHHSIAGFDAATGDPQVPWLEDRIYDEWQASGKSYADFIVDVPTFVEQSNKKKPAKELTKQGLVALDCRYLNFAPQCTGWFDLTQDGGSGSFLILWSGLWKLNTAAAIPYYTGQYGKSLRGFGFVAIGAGVSDFHRPATETGKVISSLISNTDKELGNISEETYKAIGKNLLETAMGLSVSTGIMAVLVILIAIWMASSFTRSITNMISGISRFRSGERHFRFNSPIKDEMGALADSFDDMADSLVDSLRGPVAIISLDRNILYMNDEALELVEAKLEDILGKPYGDYTIFPSDSRYCPVTALLANRETEVLYHPHNGKYYRGKANYLTNKDGENIGYVIATTDVTHIIEEQKRIEQQRAILDTVFSASPDIMWYQDARGRFLAVNPRFASIAGKNPDDIAGKTCDDIFPFELAQAMKEKNRQAVESGISMYSEETLCFADGHVETVDIVRAPLFNAQNESMGLLGVARDVSQRVFAENELRKTQLELKKAAAEANKASESKSAFLARMSHEIRTPMNAIIGMTNITKKKLSDGKAPVGEVLAHVKQIETSSQHLLGLLNDILDISKIEAGKIEISEESFDLVKLVNNVASIIRPRCLEKSITFDMRIEGLDHTVFTSDALRLRQVLINLLGNAVKFTPEGGTVLFAITHAGQGDGKALVSFRVEDDGIGIAPEIIPTLFTPFEQGSGLITKRYGGSGLGLSISSSIVTMLGGKIQVESQENKGSAFFFSLWLKESSNYQATAPAKGGEVSFADKRILLVDDVDINRIIVVEQLSGTGADIHEAADGKEAVERFAASPEGSYDLILMDVQMPYMDGYEASSTIRKLHRADAATIPIIAMTANAFKDDVDKAHAHGMNAHLAKPVDTDKLFEILGQYLG